MNQLAVLKPSWIGRLNIGVSFRHGASRLLNNYHEGPVCVQRPFYPELDGCCHLYLLHPPGGMVSGDQLITHVTAHESARCLLTTPSAAKIYQNPESQHPQETHTQLVCESHSQLEWLPQETIVFDGARMRSSLKVDLAQDACAALWEIVALGREHSDAPFKSGNIHQNIQIRRNNQLVFGDNMHIGADSLMRTQPWGLANYNAYGTFLIASPTDFPKEFLNELQQLRLHNGRVGSTFFNGVLCIRAIAQNANLIREQFTHAWEMIREQVLQKPAVHPRIWST